ncbi:MAG: minichromosome maintenance protein MCM [Nanoarchaeota archaeon]|nr:minichromosome maintenance protein MCM [Nanoarchaeota archaeon]
MVDAQDQIEKFKEFLETTYKKKIQQLTQKGKKSLIIDFSELAKFDHELSDQLLEEPEDTIKATEVAISQFDVKEVMRARFKNLPESQKRSIRNIRSADLGKFIFFEGIVRQSSDVRPQVVNAKFECPSCGTMMNIPQLEMRFREPSRCTCGRKAYFRLIKKEMVDGQRLVIEEAAEDLDGGSQSKRLGVFLKEDLVEPKMEKKTTPGTKVRVMGIISDVEIPLPSGGCKTTFDIVVNANNIEPVQEVFSDVEISQEDEEEIKKLSKDPKVYEKLTQSIAPSIMGYDKIKESLLLQLMGGVRKQKQDGTTVRGDIHILLVGDPGAGKSAMLTFIAKAAPKARYIAGKGASSAGLTASVVKDEFLKGWALEAGAMVLANKGICVLDELDKLKEEDTSALHEGMAQQTITIAKANIQATLTAQTSILAAANPKLGRFDPYKPVPDQIEMPPTLINRFDLIFPIRDLPDKDKDSKIAKHVLAQHQEPESVKTEVSVGLLRKYIAYVKQKINPVLTEEAMQEIQHFYVNLRNMEKTGNEGVRPIPITPRQLEALIRLAEASARIRLSKTVTKADSKRAIDLLKYCMAQVGTDPDTGQVDIDYMHKGISSFRRNKISVLFEIIDAAGEKGQKTIPREELVTELKLKGVTDRQADEIIDKLKREGELFEPKPGFIQKV